MRVSSLNLLKSGFLGIHINGGSSRGRFSYSPKKGYHHGNFYFPKRNETPPHLSEDKKFDYHRKCENCKADNNDGSQKLTTLEKIALICSVLLLAKFVCYFSLLANSKSQITAKGEDLGKSNKR